MNAKHTTATLFLMIVVCLWVPSWSLLAQPSREIENVAAFARLYGVVRFFYPSDAAATADWNHLAIDGVARVRTSHARARARDISDSSLSAR